MAVQNEASLLWSVTMTKRLAFLCATALGLALTAPFAAAKPSVESLLSQARGASLGTQEKCTLGTSFAIPKVFCLALRNNQSTIFARPKGKGVSTDR